MALYVLTTSIIAFSSYRRHMILNGLGIWELMKKYVRKNLNNHWH